MVSYSPSTGLVFSSNDIGNSITKLFPLLLLLSCFVPYFNFLLSFLMNISRHIPHFIAQQYGIPPSRFASEDGLKVDEPLLPKLLSADLLDKIDLSWETPTGENLSLMCDSLQFIAWFCKFGETFVRTALYQESCMDCREFIVKKTQVGEVAPLCTDSDIDADECIGAKQYVRIFSVDKDSVDAKLVDSAVSAFAQIGKFTTQIEAFESGLFYDDRVLFRSDKGEGFFSQPSCAHRIKFFRLFHDSVYPFYKKAVEFFCGWSDRDIALTCLMKSKQMPVHPSERGGYLSFH